MLEQYSYSAHSADRACPVPAPLYAPSEPKITVNNTENGVF